MAKTPRGWTGARTPSAIKRVRQAERRAAINQPRRSAAKTYVASAVKIGSGTAEGDPAQALAAAMSALDRAAKVGVIHHNNAARRKSRLALKLNALQAGDSIQAAHVTKSTGTAAAVKAARTRIATAKATKAKGPQTAAGKARAALVQDGSQRSRFDRRGARSPGGGQSPGEGPGQGREAGSEGSGQGSGREAGCQDGCSQDRGQGPGEGEGSGQGREAGSQGPGQGKGRPQEVGGPAVRSPGAPGHPAWRFRFGGRVDEQRARARQLAGDTVARGDALGWFEKLYEEAERGAAAVPWADMLPNAHLVKWLRRRRQAPSGRAIVVGCGYGDDAEFLVGAGLDVTAFDISPTAIARCRARFPGSAVTYEVADALEPPAEWLRSFDFVFEAYTVQVLRGELRARCAHRIGELVAPGGRLLVVARSRRPDDSEGLMPWPLTRAELDEFAVSGLEPAQLDEIVEPGDPPVPRFVAEFAAPR